MLRDSIPKEKVVHVFFTKTTAIYKLFSTLTSQQTLSKDMVALTMKEIAQFMEGQFNSKLFNVQKHFKFWYNMQCKPGETVPELTAKICQEATICDFM